MKTKNEKQTVFRFPFSCENEKRIKALKINTCTESIICFLISTL